MPILCDGLEDPPCCSSFSRYLPHSFVVNTVNVEGPILCLPDTWLMWDVKGFDDITPDSLALLDLVDPPPEVVVVGCGNRIRQLHPLLTQHLRARGISVEALDTVSVWCLCVQGFASASVGVRLRGASSSCGP